MKFKVKNGRGSLGRFLEFDSDKGDELDYVDAERIQRGDLTAFLQFDYGQKRKLYQFSYYLGACISVEEMLEKPFAPKQLQSLLMSLLNMVRMCEENNLARLHVVFEPQYVFFDPVFFSLRFVYVPLRLYSASTGEMAMLTDICEHADVPECDRDLADAVLDYARRTAVLTSVAFEEFLSAQGLLAVEQALEPQWGRRHETDEIDTRVSFGWDFVRQASQREQKGEDAGYQYLLVRSVDGMKYPLRDGEQAIGRANDCDIILSNSRGLSRKHACITVSAGQCLITDSNSTNGVFVNGERLVSGGSKMLRPGDRLVLASEEFKLL